MQRAVAAVLINIKIKKVALIGNPPEAYLPGNLSFSPFFDSSQMESIDVFYICLPLTLTFYLSAELLILMHPKIFYHDDNSTIVFECILIS